MLKEEGRTRNSRREVVGSERGGEEKKMNDRDSPVPDCPPGIKKKKRRFRRRGKKKKGKFAQCLPFPAKGKGGGGGGKGREEVSKKGK